MSGVPFLLIVTVTVILVGSCVCTTCYYPVYYLGGTYAMHPKYCEDGCCGYYSARACCASMTVGGVVGLVLGCLLAVGLFIGIVVCVLCIRRNRSQNLGTVLQQGQGPIMVQNQATGLLQSPYPQEQYPNNPGLSQQSLQPHDNPGFSQQHVQPYGNPCFSQQSAQTRDNPGLIEKPVQQNDKSDVSEYPVQPQ